MLNVLIASLALQGRALPADPPYTPSGPKIEVTMGGGGRFVITTDPKSSPRTVAHILALVGRGFYDRQRIHRVEYWVTQWGAPQSRDLPMNVKDPKTGQMVTNPKIAEGVSGKRLPFEESPIDFKRGVVGVASTGLQVGGDSQIFVIKQDRLYLYRSYAVVGKVTQGMDVVDRIKKGDRIKSMRVLPPKAGHLPQSRHGALRARSAQTAVPA